MKLFLKITLGALFSLAISSCTTIDLNPSCNGDCESSIITKVLNPEKSTITHGVIYSLPIQDVELLVQNKIITKVKLTAELVTLKLSAAKLKVEYLELEKKKKDLELFISKIEPDSPELSKDRAEKLAAVKIEIGIIKEAQQKLGVQIAMKQSKIDSFPKNAKEIHDFTAKLKPLAVVPSSAALLSAIVRDSAISSETAEIKTTASGLLSGGSGTSEGNIDEIFVSLAGAVGGFKGVDEAQDLPDIGAMSFKQKSLFVPPADSPCKQMEFKKSFRLKPYQGKQDPLKEVNDFFLSISHCFKAKLGSERYTSEGYKDVLSDFRGEEKSYLDGLVYPRQAPFNISICKATKLGNKLECLEGVESDTKFLTTNIITPKALGVLKLERGWFADNNYEYEFNEGLLTRFKSDKGNEFVSFFGMFPNIAKALISIPAEIVQLKFDMSDKERAYFEAQTEILKQQIKYDYYSKNPDAVITEAAAASEEPEESETSEDPGS